MNTPDRDDQGRPLLPDAEYHRIHMLEPEDFEKLPENQQQLYFATHDWHRAQRIGNSTLDPSTIKTGSGMSQKETIELWKKAQSQQGN
jgi:hypothetical protein